jgi:hypothetical protein
MSKFINLSNKASPKEDNNKEKPIQHNKSTNTVNVYIGHGVTAILNNDSEVDFTTIKCLKDVEELYEKKPNILLGVTPMLYKEFINSKTNEIKKFVKEGDLVEVIAKFRSRPVDSVPRIVKNVYLKSLFNMSVFIAELDDGDIQLTNRLKVL